MHVGSELGPDGFYLPEQYSPLWLILGIAILLLIIGWYVFVLVWTRRKREPYVGLPFPEFEPGVGLRDTYLSLVDDVVGAHRDGTIDNREAHQQLGVIVREFAAQARGVRAQYMTLEDLRAAKLTPLSATVGELYPEAFGVEPTGSVDTAANRARRLVSEWK